MIIPEMCILAHLAISSSEENQFVSMPAILNLGTHRRYIMPKT